MKTQDKTEAIVRQAEKQIMNGTYYEDVAIAAAMELGIKQCEFSDLFCEITGFAIDSYTEQLIEQELV